MHGRNKGKKSRVKGGDREDLRDPRPVYFRAEEQDVFSRGDGFIPTKNCAYFRVRDRGPGEDPKAVSERAYGEDLPPRFIIKIYIQIFSIKGKESVGPNYDVTDKFTYNRGPTHLIGTQIRKDKETEPKYDHYYRQDQDLDPLEAERLRRPRSQTTKIGLESRFPSNPKSMRGTPGP